MRSASSSRSMSIESHRSMGRPDLLGPCSFDPRDSPTEFYSRTKSFVDLPSPPTTRVVSAENPLALPYFYRATDRERSEEILRSINRPGCFLIREHHSDPSSFIASPYVLSLVDPSLLIKHFLLYSLHGQLLIKPYSTEFYSSIEHFVRIHQSERGVLPCLLSEYPIGVSIDDQGICSTLFIEGEHLQRGEIIGRGHFGIVYQGKYHEKIRVALKTLSMDECEVNVLNEARLMMCVHHRCVVHLYGITRVDNQMSLVLELIVNGSLLSWLEQQREKNKDEEDSSATSMLCERLEMFAYQICDAMTYLESKSIVHRDLAARNCFIDDKANLVKIGDFGMARIVRCSSMYVGRCDAPFPLRWSSPEVLLFREYSSKSDVWSYGILLWEMFSLGETPFGASMSNEVVSEAIQTGQMPSKPRLAEQFFYRHVIVACWTGKVNDRPSFLLLKEIFDKVLLHPSKTRVIA